MKTETINNVTHYFLSTEEFKYLVDDAGKVIKFCYAKMGYETNLEKSEIDEEYLEDAEHQKELMESIELSEKDSLFVKFNLASESHGEILVKQWEV